MTHDEETALRAELAAVLARMGKADAHSHASEFVPIDVVAGELAAAKDAEKRGERLDAAGRRASLRASAEPPTSATLAARLDACGMHHAAAALRDP